VNYIWLILFRYNCGDEYCYKDLSHLRGVNYITWTKSTAVKPDKPGVHPTSKEPHEKFANYRFEVAEFVRLAQRAIELVRRHPEFVQRQRKLKKSIKSEF
jgi:hypothetical protein